MSTPEDQVPVAGAGTAPLELPAPEEQVDPNAISEEERKAVENLTKEYKTARAFDRPALNQIGHDRRYVSGTAGESYVVNANLLGSYVDILTSFIYSRNPKVSIRPSEQTGQAAQRTRQLFAKTLQIVVGRLWSDGKLKKAMKRVVRAGFSVSTGWFKAAMLFDTKTDPQIESELNDVRDNLARIRAAEEELDDDPTTGEPVDRDVKIGELELLIEGLESKLEIVLRKGMAIDFVSTEQVQVALDVRDMDDYLEAGWVGDEMYVPKSELRARLPALTEEDVKSATTYYQKAPLDYSRQGDALVQGTATVVTGDADPQGMASQYSTNSSYAGQALTQSEGKPVEYGKIIEIWDRRDVHIKTIVEGVKRWGKEPYTPQFATSRFYPYFKVDFFPVDGERWAQSLTYRLCKLQDEYGGVRSSYRTTRQRSIPGTLFNASQIDEENMVKITNAVHDEFIPVKPKDPEVDLNKLFAQKPLPTIDGALFDTQAIIGDMEKISGVQEALQTSQTVEKTATQAEIEQGGFAARTTAERDCVEETLDEFARYTAELALQALTYDDVVKIAGPLAFWPEDLPREAITQLLDIEIEAGSTGRPNASSEREAWVTILPLAKELIGLILQTQGTPIAQAYTELLRETLTRFDDRLDIERFLPGVGDSMTQPLLAGPAPIDPLLGGRGPGGAPMPAPTDIAPEAPGADGLPAPGTDVLPPAPDALAA